MFKSQSFILYKSREDWFSMFGHFGSSCFHSYVFFVLPAGFVSVLRFSSQLCRAGPSRSHSRYLAVWFRGALANVTWRGPKKSLEKETVLKKMSMESLHELSWIMNLKVALDRFGTYFWVASQSGPEHVQLRWRHKSRASMHHSDLTTIARSPSIYMVYMPTYLGQRWWPKM